MSKSNSKVIRMAAIKSVNKFLWVLVVWVSITTSIALVVAQYNGPGGFNYGGAVQTHMSPGDGSAGQEELEGPEDRPKVRLGIRLRIPAFKFELPRFSMPKITVSAKIRQPDGPRVIRLPEINLDTSSRVEPPGGGGGGGGKAPGDSGGYPSPSQYQAGPSYSMASYGGRGGGSGDAGKSNTFTFSTGEESGAHEQPPTPHYGTDAASTPQRYPLQTNQYRRPPSPVSALAAKTNYNHQAAHYHRPPVVSMQQPRAAYGGGNYRASYRASTHQPSYSVYNMPPGGVGGQSAYQYRVEEASANPELGFNSRASS